jgi:sugar lactone lactonase YvrE
VADSNNSRVTAWSADGLQAISQIDCGYYVNGVCVDLNGLLYASVGDTVKIYDPRRNGAPLLQTLGGKKGDAPGQFNYPAGMCVDDTNTLMVVDRWNIRVQFFRS